MKEFLYKNLSFLIIGAAMEVHRLLGPGFLESVYEEALGYEFGLRGIAFESQIPVEVKYKNTNVGIYKPDMLVENKIILEIKAVTGFVPAHEAKAHHYLIATGMRLALLLNFGTESLQIKRIIR